MADIRNFKSVEGGKQETGSAASEAVAEMKQNIGDFLEYQAIRAKMKRQHYEHLLTEGFTETEALDIVKSDPTM